MKAQACRPDPAVSHRMQEAACQVAEQIEHSKAMCRCHARHVPVLPYNHYNVQPCAFCPVTTQAVVLLREHIRTMSLPNSASSAPTIQNPTGSEKELHSILCFAYLEDRNEPSNSQVCAHKPEEMSVPECMESIKLPTPPTLLRHFHAFLPTSAGSPCVDFRQ